MRGRVMVAAIALLTAPWAWAGWWDIHRADQRFDLDAARTAALVAVADDPTGADGVGAALWWLENLNHLPDPSEILVFDEGRRDPELGFLKQTYRREFKHARVKVDLDKREGRIAWSK